MSGERDKVPALPPDPAKREVDDFLNRLAATPAPVRQPGERGRLIFAMDATASREPTWDTAMHIQSEMFKETAALGGLDVQLAWYRGFGEFRASDFLGDAESLMARMTGVTCLAGRTQIGRLLRHALAEGEKRKIAALVFIGDAMEEKLDALGDLAGRLGLLGVRCFLFHEGRDPAVAHAFQQIARLSGGACCAFDAGSARQLRELLAAVAVYAAGGRRALENYGRRTGGKVLQITNQMTDVR